MRSIPALIATVFANEPITAAEFARLHRHMALAEKKDAAMLRGVSLGDVSTDDLGREFDAFRTDTLKAIRSEAAPALRERVRLLLYQLGIYVELIAAREGVARRQHTQRVLAGRQRGAQERKEAERFLAEVSRLAQKAPARTKDTAIAERYLARADPDWSASSASARTRKRDAFTRRMRRARKITGRPRR